MDPKRSHSGSADVEEDTLENKKSRTEDQPPQLPPEMWELIFQNLSTYWLRSARLTCTSWNQIIRGSPQLMDKFVLTLTAENFNDDRKAVRDLLETGDRYTKARLAFFGIGRHKPRVNWFKPLGATLHTLSLELTGSEEFLTQLLKEMPNLKQLNLKANSKSAFQNVTPDFRLEKLTELTISHLPTPSILSYCRKICSNLTVLKLCFLNLEKFDEAIVNLVGANCKTLQELTVNVSGGIVDCLAKHDDLRLRRLSVGEAVCGTVLDVLRLIKQQPNLEELNVMARITIPNVYEIIAALPKLRNLKVDLEPQNTQLTLSCMDMSRIESLTINYGYYHRSTSHPLELTNCNLPRVRHLSLYQCNLSHELLLDLQRTNISQLTLKDCILERLSHLLLLKSLKHVKLSGINRIRDLSEPTAEEGNDSSIRSLKMSRVDLKKCLPVVKIFPNLERFEAADGASISEVILQALSQRSPRLKELIIRSDCIGYIWGDKGLREGVNHFGALETIRVHCYHYERATILKALRGSNAAIEIYIKPEHDF